MKKHTITLAALALAAACADPAAQREQQTGVLLDEVTPPPAVDATNDAAVPSVPGGRTVPADYGITGVNEAIPSTDAASTSMDNGAVQMRTDSATPVGPIP